MFSSSHLYSRLFTKMTLIILLSVIMSLQIDFAMLFIEKRSLLHFLNLSWAYDLF